MKEAVCCIIENDGKFLAVARKDDNSKWGLPGGKVDPGETSRQAIIREVFEETGLCLRHMFFVPVYTSVCYGDVDYRVVGYIFAYAYKEKFPLLVPEKDSLVDWKTPEELCDPNISPFSEYNKKMFLTVAGL